MKQPYLLILGWLLLAIPVYSQDSPDGIGVIPTAETPEVRNLPRTFREISLGMSLEDLKKILEQDGLFHFRGDRDVSFLPTGEQSLVETTGFSFIRRAFFQLREGSLFIMAFSLDPSLIDHYSVFIDFVKKYGEPLFLNPGQAVWESEDTRIAIERPLTVKYIDKAAFAEIMGESAVKESGEVFLREEFLNGF
ncbi:hypothetical protein LQZ21_02125 [Treponema sp. TIM-1]|uniref:hypothetical protein n=1 Tax=Treponema sp. TIM-1 TaxID=2898417 RepID=UPI003980A811